MTTEERLSKIEAKLDEILMYVRHIETRNQLLDAQELSSLPMAPRFTPTAHEMKPEKWPDPDLTYEFTEEAKQAKNFDIMRYVRRTKREE